ILATPKRYHSLLKRHLRDKKIDLEPYQTLLK
ncbi:DUF2621 family protein, partial [Streptomyces sp. NPDC059016]